MGLGRRTFAPGEVLTASNVMNYLMYQSVMNFAGTAARGSAIGTAVAEGMVSYQNDSNTMTVYDGSVWQQVYPSVANAGEIVQVVTTTKTDTFSTTSTSLTDVTGLSASITPAATANKVLVTVSIPFGVSNTVEISIFTITDGSNNILLNAASPGNRTPGIINLFGLPSAAMGLATFSFVHSPNTTSSFTYKIRAQASGGATLHVNRGNADENAGTRTRGIATITLSEIKG